MFKVTFATQILIQTLSKSEQPKAKQNKQKQRTLVRVHAQFPSLKIAHAVLLAGHAWDTKLIQSSLLISPLVLNEPSTPDEG